MHASNLTHSYTGIGSEKRLWENTKQYRLFQLIFSTFQFCSETAPYIFAVRKKTNGFFFFFCEGILAGVEIGLKLMGSSFPESHEEIPLQFPCNFRFLRLFLDSIVSAVSVRCSWFLPLFEVYFRIIPQCCRVEAILINLEVLTLVPGVHSCRETVTQT